MATRKEEKERLRQQRLAAEAAERAQQRRRLVIGYVSAGVLVALIVVGIVVAVTKGGGGSSGSSDVAKQTTNPGSVPAAAEQGTRTTKPPWPPLYNGLANRLQVMGLPGFNETTFHIHAWLHVYVNGKPVTVPPNIGLDEVTGTISPLHTHDSTGIVHMEADEAYPFTLGQFFSVWGVRFSDTQIGAYKTGQGNILQVYFNGKPVKDPVNAVMHEHVDISVGYGKPGSFPKQPKVHWPQGL